MLGVVPAQAGPRYRSSESALTLPGGESILVRYKVPEKMQGRLPLVLIFGGFETAGEVLTLINPAKPVILASFDYPFRAPRKLRFPESLGLAPHAKQALHQTREAIPLVIQKFIADRADVDPDRVVVIGASFGAPFALYAAMDSPEVDAVAIVHGFGDVPGTIQHRLRQIWGPKYGVWADVLAWPFAHLGWWYLALPSPSEAAGRLRENQRALLIEATEDHFIPSESRAVLREALMGSAARTTIQSVSGDHLQPGAVAQLRDIFRRIETWL